MMTKSAFVVVILTATVFATPSILRAVDDFGPMNPPQVIPYRGYVEINGEGFTGDLEMRFTLSEASTVDRDTGFLWQDDAITAQVHRGQFSTLLGDGAAPLPAGVFDHDFLYLGIDIDPAGDDSWLVLSNAQRLRPVPYAYMAAQSRDLLVDGDLEVTGDASVTGQIAAAEVVWGSGGARLVDEEGGSIELGGLESGISAPYIDFHHQGLGEDYNVRLANDADGQLSINGGATGIDGSLELGDTAPAESGGNPYIDFNHLGTSDDYNVRLINDADGQLSLVGGDLEIDGLSLGPHGDAAGPLNVDAPTGRGLVLDSWSGADVVFGDGGSEGGEAARVTPAGDVTIGRDLTVGGDITNLQYSGTYVAVCDQACSSTVEVTMGDGFADRFCFLTSIQLVDLNNETWFCHLRPDHNDEVWRLEAYSDAGVRVQCNAHCLSWSNP